MRALTHSISVGRKILQDRLARASSAGDREHMQELWRDEEALFAVQERIRKRGAISISKVSAPSQGGEFAQRLPSCDGFIELGRQ
ncbi:hypothetical protein HWV62_11742 [Athelia sp. TMB]|nr:hypothetical protein HWV62_11742 [Athelia sp. TMB]